MVARAVRAMVWVRLAMAGSVLMALCALLYLVRVPLLPVHGEGFWYCVWAYRLRTAVYLLPFAVSLGLLVWAERRFKQGYQDDLWSEAELAEVRRLAEWRYWSWISLTVSLVWTAVLCCKQSLHGGGLWYVLMMPSQTALRIRRLVAPPVERSSGLLDWGRNFGPLRSEHWGERSV